MGDVSAGKILAAGAETTMGGARRIDFDFLAGDADLLDRVAERLFANAISEAPTSDPLLDKSIATIAEWSLDTAAVYVNVRRRLIDAAKIKEG